MSLELVVSHTMGEIQIIAATFTEWPLIVEYENRIEVDTKTQTDPFLCVKTKFLDGYQVEISDRPHQRWIGQVHLAAAIPDGAGVAKARKLLDFFYPKLQRKKFGLMRTRMAEPGGVTDHLGWEYHGVIVPFWADVPT